MNNIITADLLLNFNHCKFCQYITVSCFKASLLFKADVFWLCVHLSGVAPQKKKKNARRTCLRRVGELQGIQWL